jgi:6-phosphogluconate dehydrogenase (decarboxylating)
MRVGMIGLGRMGANMVQRLMHAGNECVVYDVSADAGKKLAKGESASRYLASGESHYVNFPQGGGAHRRKPNE